MHFTLSVLGPITQLITSAKDKCQTMVSRCIATHHSYCIFCRRSPFAISQTIPAPESISLPRWVASLTKPFAIRFSWRISAMLPDYLGRFEHAFSEQRATHSLLHAVVQNHSEEVPVALASQQLRCDGPPNFKVASLSSWVLAQPPNDTNPFRLWFQEFAESLQTWGVSSASHEITCQNFGTHTAFHSKARLCHQNRAWQTKFCYAIRDAFCGSVCISTCDSGFPRPAAWEDMKSNFAVVFFFLLFFFIRLFETPVLLCKNGEDRCIDCNKRKANLQ